MSLQDRIEVVQGDLTKMKVDAIVNAANSSLLGGGGVDGAIHRAAGKELLAECRDLRGCKTGQAKITGGYLLPARHVIHTVGPVWRPDTPLVAEQLAACYRNSLALAEQHGLQEIAFPSISTGAYRFPIAEAARIALATVAAWLTDHAQPAKVYHVCFSEDDRAVYQQALTDRCHRDSA